MAVKPGAARAQQNIELDIQLEDLVTNAQVLGLTTLGVNRQGQGEKLANLLIRNDTDRPQEKLYFHVTVSSTQHGVIAEIDQRGHYPFHLEPNQVVYATNNSLQNGLPGIQDPLHFYGGLTDQGKDFVNSLEGQTRLPNDAFTLQVDIYQGENRVNGGEKVATSSATIGTKPISETRDIYIKAPGDVVGSGSTLYNAFPEFSWEGEIGTHYRVIVVKANGTDTPETLLESARSTDPMLENGTHNGGTLLQYEMADAIVNKPSFQFPSSGVQQLNPGATYYWQVSALLKTASGTQEQRSEIWSFTMADQNSSSGNTEMKREIQQSLKGILSDETFNEILSGDMDLQSIVINGQTYSGPAMLQKLNEFMEKIRNGDIKVTIESQ